MDPKKIEKPTVGFKVHGTGTLSTKGQIVIPTELRKQLDLNDGDKVFFMSYPGTKGFGVVKATNLADFYHDMGKMAKSATQDVALMNKKK